MAVVKHESESDASAKDVYKRRFQGADGLKYTWLDADSLDDGSEQTLRIKGFNAAETNKIIDRNGEMRFVQGQLGAKEQTEAAARIAEAGAFNIIQDDGELDTYGRRLVRLVNEKGEDFTNTLYESGAVNENYFTDQAGVDAASTGRLKRQMQGKSPYSNIVDEELSAIKTAPVEFKGSVSNEKEYLDSVVNVIASQKGLNLYNEDEFRQAYNIALDGNYDSRSLNFNAIDFRYADRTEEGVAYNQFTSAWNTGWKGMLTGLAGFSELAGVSIGNETLKTWGADNVDIAKRDLQNAPLLRNMDFREIDGVFDGFQYITNNMAMSAPYLLTLIAGTAAAPFTKGISAVAAYGSIFGVHSGNVWNGIKGPKGGKEAAGSMAAGFAMALLERVGLKGILKPSAMLTKEGREQVLDQLVLERGITRLAAEKLLKKEGKSVIKGAIEGIGNFASDNIKNNQILKEMLKGGARGGVLEGFTEAAQEGTGYTASAAMSEGGLEDNFNTNEFTNLLAQSAVAGASLGTSFGMAGQAIDAGDRFAIQKGLMLGRVDRLSDFERLAIEIGPQGSVENITEDLQKKMDGKKGGSKTASLAAAGEESRGSFWDKVKNPAKFLPELYRGGSTTGFDPETLRQSKSARQLRALVGQIFGNLYSGRDVSSKENQIRSRLLNTINPKRMFARFGMMDRVSNSGRISEMVRRYMVANGDKSKLKDDAEVLENYDAIEATIIELRAYHRDASGQRDATYISQDTRRAGTRLPFEEDGWMTNRQWDWSKVRNNRDAWFTWMRKNAVDSQGRKIYTEQELEEMFNKISNNEVSADFSIVEGAEFIPGRTKGSTQQLSLLPGFDAFANNDVIQNAIFDINQTARYTAYTDYFGAGGKYLDYLFKQMENEGLSEDKIKELAYHTKSMIDSGTGNYKTIKNRKVLAFQRAGAFYATIVGLPMAAISSFPEFVMLLYQGRGAKDINNAINAFTGQLVGALKEVANMKLNPALTNMPEGMIYRPATQQLVEAGLFPDDATVATRYGLGETDISKAWWQKSFFKYTLITGVTQLQRAMAASAVHGFVSDRVRILLARKEDVPMNQDQMEIYLQLQNLGMDVESYLEAQRALNWPDRDSNGLTIYDKYMDPSNQDSDIVALRDSIDDQLSTVTWYFVNDRIQNPQAYNRPLFFQDPHYQLFVQFNGFISTFTANIVPKLWNDYIRKGSPRMKYNTFALLVTMMGVGGASQWLKDYIKFGKSTPYLNDAQLVQRAIMSSGVLGTGERAVQAIAPLYSSRDENIVQRLFGETLGGAPTIRLVDTARKAAVEASEGDYEGFLRNVAKLTPGIAPVTPARNAFTALMQGKKPTGYPFD